MASWLKDIPGSVIFFLSVTFPRAGFRVIASQILVGIRTVLGAVLGGLSLESSSLP
jgi:hypothetical protein